MNLLIMNQIVPLLYVYKDGFGIKWPTKVEKSLNKESKLYKYVKISMESCILLNRLVICAFCLFQYISFMWILTWMCFRFFYGLFYMVLFYIKY